MCELIAKRVNCYLNRIDGVVKFFQVLAYILVTHGFITHAIEVGIEWNENLFLGERFATVKHALIATVGAVVL